MATFVLNNQWQLPHSRIRLKSRVVLFPFFPWVSWLLLFYLSKMFYSPVLNFLLLSSLAPGPPSLSPSQCWECESEDVCDWVFGSGFGVTFSRFLQVVVVTGSTCSGTNWISAITTITCGASCCFHSTCLYFCSLSFSFSVLLALRCSCEDCPVAI